MDLMDLMDEVMGYAKANAEAARTLDGQMTWEAHHRNLLKIKAAISAKIESDAKAIAERDTRVAQLCEDRDCIPELEAQIASLRAALNGLLDKHCELVNSGDCGFWDVEGEGAVIAARRALEFNEQEASK